MFRKNNFFTKAKKSGGVVECLPIAHGMLGSVSSTKIARCGDETGTPVTRSSGGGGEDQKFSCLQLLKQVWGQPGNTEEKQMFYWQRCGPSVSLSPAWYFIPFQGTVEKCLDLKIVCVWVLCLLVCIYALCMCLVPKEDRRGYEVPWNWSYSWSEVLGSKVGFLQEQGPNYEKYYTYFHVCTYLHACLFCCSSN